MCVHMQYLCTPHAHHMYTTCTPHAHHMYTTCTSHAHHLPCAAGVCTQSKPRSISPTLWYPIWVVSFLGAARQQNAQCISSPSTPSFPHTCPALAISTSLGSRFPSSSLRCSPYKSNTTPPSSTGPHPQAKILSTSRVMPCSTSSGSITFPSVLLILRPWVSLTMA